MLIECSVEHGLQRPGCRQGGRLACGGAMGQRPRRTAWNMLCMSVTCPTSQSRGWLKLGALCQVRAGGGEKWSHMTGAEAAGCRQGGRLLARVRCSALGQRRAYREHASHARDLRDVPVQRLVEAGGVLPGAERGRARNVQRAWGSEAAGCRQGRRLACGAVARCGSGLGVRRT